MSGWVPFDADWWPAIVEKLPRPWPDAAALFDLRWHVDRSASKEVPHGKRFWMKRWGWTDWKVRSLLREGAWHDPIHPLPAQAPPALRPQTAQDPPASRRLKLTKLNGTAQDPPADRPDAAQDPPADRHTRGDPPSPSPSPSQDTLPAARAAWLSAPPEEDEPEEPANGVPKWAKVKGFDSHAVLASVAHALSEIRQRPIDPWHAATDAKHVIGLQRATNTPWNELAEQLALVARWARDSEDHMAANDIRGMRPDGSTWSADRSRSVSTLCVLARWADRLEAAQRWDRGELLRPRARGEHPSERQRRLSNAELIAADPSIMDPI